MESDFEKGREYERKQRDISFHKYLGWYTLLIAPIWYFYSVWDFNTRINGWAGLTLFGCCALLFAYSEVKELKEIKNGK